jgi:hypothetical protein
VSVSDDPQKALEELRLRLAAEGLPKLSSEALRAARVREQIPRAVLPPIVTTVPKLSAEARRLFEQKSDPRWLWRKR